LSGMAFPSVVADKVAASLEMHNGTPSSRYRDLADLYLIQAQVSFDRRQLREAVLAELARRNLERLPNSWCLIGSHGKGMEERRK